MGMLKEFKEFAMKGNVVDLAVAVIIGTAFGKIVTELNATIIMPLVSMVMGKGGVELLTTSINGTAFPYGKFLQAVIDFILVAFVLFLIVKALNSMKKKEHVTLGLSSPNFGLPASGYELRAYYQ
jgi:large conductance mechanosensitive channel